MPEDLLCKKVSSLLSQYIDNKVTRQEKEFIEEHLAMCPDCYKKFIYLKNLINSLKDSYKKVMNMALQKQRKATFSIRDHENFRTNLSPYLDNELPTGESFTFRKYLVKSKMAQRELRQAYSLQKKLHNSFELTKKQLKTDFSKLVLSEIKEQRKFLYKQKTAKIAILAGLLLFGGFEFTQFATPIVQKFENKLHQKETIQYPPSQSSSTIKKSNDALVKQK